MKYKADLLDLLEAVAVHEQPLMYVHITFDVMLDIPLLFHAVLQCAKHVPELLCTYQKQENCFYSIDNVTSDRIIQEVKQIDFSFWDFEKHPQLQIQYHIDGQHCEFAFACSHMLCDGSGLKQLLSLLCTFYNTPYVPFSDVNQRHLSTHLSYVSSKTKQKRKSKKTLVLKATTTTLTPFPVVAKYRLNALKTYASDHNFTLNDVLLYGWWMALYKQLHVTQFSLPCPVDLRKFLLSPPPLSIANFTGEYRINLTHHKTMKRKDFVQEIHVQMANEKVRNDDLCTLKRLYRFSVMPAPILTKIAQSGFHLPDISYTNVGKIDVASWNFHDANILDCYISSRYRMFPRFQLTLSTFQDTLTLSCNMLGDVKQKRFLEVLLDDMIKELDALIVEA